MINCLWQIRLANIKDKIEQMRIELKDGMHLADYATSESLRKQATRIQGRIIRNRNKASEIENSPESLPFELNQAKVYQSTVDKLMFEMEEVRDKRW
jgi:hypothetical protein